MWKILEFVFSGVDGIPDDSKNRFIYLLIAVAMTFGAAGFFLGKEYNQYIVGYKEIELFKVRNELAEARRTLTVINPDSSSDSAVEHPVVLASLMAPADVADSAKGNTSAEQKAAFVCLSKGLGTLGFYDGEVTTEGTRDLVAASELYRDYMSEKDPYWNQEALSSGNSPFWCQQMASAFSSVREYFEEFKTTTGQ